MFGVVVNLFVPLLTFTTTFVDLQEQMLELFGAVMITMRWPAPAPVAVAG